MEEIFSQYGGQELFTERLQRVAHKLGKWMWGQEPLTLK
jgi:hypothetical protein